jgi:alpha-ribazole phosphatase/probable phosphoglycerate mutase
MAGRFCGHSDPELNERGRQQLAGLINMLSEHEIRQVYTSDLRRAQQTAEAIATHLGAGLHVRPGLREIHFGLWEGLSWSEIEVRHPALAKSWAEEYPNSTAPGGESFQQFQSRVCRETDFLLGEATRSSIVVVSHAGFIRVTLTNWCRVSEQEAWDRTKGYGSVVALDTRVMSLRDAVLFDDTLRGAQNEHRNKTRRRRTD